MSVNEWPPRVWHGVVDPVTGENISPIRLSNEQIQTELDWIQETLEKQSAGCSELAQGATEAGKRTGGLPD